MASISDLALFSRDGRLMAVADIRSRRGTSAEWAAQLRRNILAHGDCPDVDFFVIVTLDHVYLWKEAGTEPEEVEPDYEINAEPLFAPYVQGTRVNLAEVRRPVFELIVTSWLGDLLRAESKAAALGRGNGLVMSGFVDAIRGGRIEDQLAA